MAVSESADAELKPQVDALQDAIDELGPAVETIDDGGAAASRDGHRRCRILGRALIGSLEDAQCE